MGERLTKQIVNKRLTNIGSEIRLLGEYVNTRYKSYFLCENNHKFISTAGKALEGHGCKTCYIERISIPHAGWIGDISIKEMTQEYLKECIKYNSITGEFYRIKRPYSHFRTKKAMDMYNKRFAEINACQISKKGYLRIKINHYHIQAHRLAWVYTYGEWPKDQIDHINGVKDDNRICNLREANNSQNHQNIYECRIHNKSGLLGVSLRSDNGRYRSTISLDKITYNLGSYSTAKEAHDEYIKAKRKLHKYGEL